MVDALVFLTSVTIVLLAGIVSVALSKRLKIPLPLTLLFSGVILWNIKYQGFPIVQLSGTFLSTFSIISLLVVLFDSLSKVRFYDFDKSMFDSLKFFFLASILNLIVISFAAKVLFNMEWFSATIFSLFVSCVEYNTIFSKNHTPKNKISILLKNESLLSCAFILLIPFLIIYYVQLQPLNAIVFNNILSYAVNILAGIGAGVVVALVLFKLMNSVNFEKTSSFVLAVGLLVAYLFSEQLGGSGLIAVATIAVIFGNIFLRHKDVIKKQENIVYSILEIFVFIFVGNVVGMSLSLDFYKLSLGLFFLYLLIRVISAQIMLRHHDFMDRLEVALFVPKGLATMTATFALLGYSFVGVVLLVRLLFVFFVYSLIFDTILDKFGFYKSR